jgi:hypothetical protein
MLPRTSGAVSTPGRSVALTSALIGSAALLFLLRLGVSPPNTLTPARSRSTPVDNDPRLHLLFPLDERSHSTRSCKTLLTALVNGYSPTIVNWDVVGTKDELYSAKIPGVANYIARTLSTRDDADYAMMADSYDLWLQLGPRALIRRFREMEAKIVIGVDMWCWPNDPNSVRLE